MENRKIVELVSVVAVVASLLFVGIQLQLDRNVAMGEQYATRTAMTLGIHQSLIESDNAVKTLSKVWEDGIKPFWWIESDPTTTVGATGIDVVVMTAFNNQLMLVFDNNRYQYERGLMEEADYLMRHELVKGWMRGSLSQKAFWTDSRTNFTRSIDIFREIASELENE